MSHGSCCFIGLTALERPNVSGLCPQCRAYAMSCIRTASRYIATQIDACIGPHRRAAGLERKGLRARSRALFERWNRSGSIRIARVASRLSALIARRDGGHLSDRRPEQRVCTFGMSPLVLRTDCRPPARPVAMSHGAGVRSCATIGCGRSTSGV